MLSHKGLRLDGIDEDVGDVGDVGEFTFQTLKSWFHMFLKRKKIDSRIEYII